MYQSYIYSIPTVSEQTIFLHKYAPFSENNLLTRLDENSSLIIADNFPVLDGATALYPLYASFAQAVYQKGDYNITREFVLCNRTDGAYENLFNGKVDIIFCARPSKEQLNFIRENNLNVKFIEIGKEAFVFFVNSKNVVNNLTIENIQGIYSGRITNWNELGGKNKNIRAFQRPKNSGSQTMLENIMENTPIMSPRRENVASGMGDIINQVAVYRNFSNAIGYSFLFFTTEMSGNEQIKILSINSIFPSRETIQNESYPFTDNFYAIYIDNEEKNENIEVFIEWILSEQGQELVQKTGYTPIK